MMAAMPPNFLDQFFALSGTVKRLWRWVNGLGINRVQYGQTIITPSGANTPTSITVTFTTPFPPGTGVRAQVTAVTTAPGTGVTGVAVNNVTTTSMDIWLTRTSVVATTIYWIAYI